MFHHVKELQFNARVSGPDARFAGLLLEQFGGPNGELKAAMQYFVQSFAARQPYPDKYDMLMDIATEELSHLEIVGATITMLLDGVNGELKNAAESTDVVKLARGGRAMKESMIHDVTLMPSFLTRTGGGPALISSEGIPWSGTYVNANGDLTVDLRSNIAAESRAKIVYEYLLQFTDDPYVQDSLRFLMTREIAHFQMFSAALETIQPNFPPGVLQGDPRFTHTYFNMSNGVGSRGPWNEGQGPWAEGEQWEYIEDPMPQVSQTRGQLDKRPEGNRNTPREIEKKDKAMSRLRSQEVKSRSPKGPNQWSTYSQENSASAMDVQGPSAVRTNRGASRTRK